jgi:hypothetical protein
MSWHTSELRVVPGALVLADAPERLAVLVAG